MYCNVVVSAVINLHFISGICFQITAPVLNTDFIHAVQKAINYLDF